MFLRALKETNLSFSSSNEESSGRFELVEPLSYKPALPTKKISNASFGEIASQLDSKVLTQNTAAIPKQQIHNFLPFNSNFKKQQFRPGMSMVTVSKWECVITQVDKDCFTAVVNQVLPIAQKDYSATRQDISEFYLEDVDSRDIPLIKEGAVFYWNIGYMTNASGQRINQSVVVFPRLPAWSQYVKERADKKADELALALGWE